MAVSRIDEAGLNVTQYGNRNLIINGAMQVAQRGTSATVTTTGSSFDALDRYESYKNSSYAPNYTLSRDATGPDGFSHSLKIEVDATATPTTGQNFGIRTKIEGYDAARIGQGTSGSKECTLSFYVKSNKTGTYGIQMFRFGATTYSTTKGYTVDAADTWERKEITFTAFTTNNTPNVTNGIGTMIHFELSTGSGDAIAPFDWTLQGAARTVTGQVNLMDSTSNYWQITGVQLEVGDTATEFEHRSRADELLRCQRYYFNSDEADSFISAMDVTSGNAYYFTIMHPTTMRTGPTITLSNESNSNFDGITVFRNYSTRWGGYDVATGSGRGYWQFEYEADAEL